MLQLSRCIFGIFLISIISAVFSEDEITFVRIPDGMKLEGSETIRVSQLKDLFSAALGFTIDSGKSGWSGLVTPDPFHYAEGIAVVVVESAAYEGGHFSGRAYPLERDAALDDSEYSLERAVRERYPENATFLHFDLEREAELSGVGPNAETKYLDPSRAADGIFLQELNLVKKITNTIAGKSRLVNGIPDILWFQSEGLSVLVDTYGIDSDRVDEARLLLNNALGEMAHSLAKIYKDKVLVAVISTEDNSYSRFERSVSATAATPSDCPSSTLNLSADYDEVYPAMFNIILWFTIGFFFVVILVAVGTCLMDPGKDSIIYRVTSQRKKDN